MTLTKTQKEILTMLIEEEIIRLKNAPKIPGGGLLMNAVQRLLLKIENEEGK